MVALHTGFLARVCMQGMPVFVAVFGLWFGANQTIKLAHGESVSNIQNDSYFLSLTESE